MRAGYEREKRVVDLLVVGGGLAGLATAALVARAGRSVVVLERSGRLGGRASTQVLDGVRFNLGAHALYRAGQASRLLDELGVAVSGRAPDPGVGLFLDGAESFPIPSGLAGLLAGRGFSIRERWRFARILSEIPKFDARRFDRVGLADWIAGRAGRGRLARALAALFRVSTFVADQGRLSAGAAIDQLKLGLAGGVWYLDGGWQTIVDGLRDRAIAAGAEVRTGAKVEGVRTTGDLVSARLADGTDLRAGSAVLAAGPEAAHALLGVEVAPAPPIPIRAATLDLALAGLPRPRHRFALGLDRPLYYSVHSSAARLAPEGVAVVHAMRYLGDGPEPPSAETERELEGLLDRLQPGWRDRVVRRRLLPGMVVSPMLPTAESGGLAGRPSVEVPGHPGVYLAGDWVGPEGMLADASAASAREAARRVLAATADLHRRSASHAVA